VNDITEDNVVNKEESEGLVTVSGSVTAPLASGDAVKVTVNGVVYKTTVDEEGNWSVKVNGSDLIEDDTVDVEVLRANTVLAQKEVEYDVDLVANGDVILDNITDDNILTAAEASGNVTVSGSVTEEFAEHDSIKVIVNGHTYTTTVDADLNWELDIPGTHLAADSLFKVIATGKDEADNPINAETVSTHTVNVITVFGDITINDITEDNVLNNSESEGLISVSGIVTGEFAEGDIVSFTVNGKDYSAEVDSDLNWAVEVDASDLAADTVFTVNAEGEDSAGNPINANIVSTHTVDIDGGDTNIPSENITINTITDDNVLNNEESEGLVSVSGSITTGYTSGDDVKVTVNGVVYKTTVDEDGNFSVEVNGTDLAKDDTVDVAILRDDVVIGQDAKDYSVDLEGEGDVTVNNIT
ncbi:MAG: Ig-like domain-containing protein, partial [Gammaproteobacteria bacterium]|nr:Ig-like domain-containing protein [Gammaproteobacteria bacterium]